MTDSRPVLLGMNNPLSDAPQHALAPYPRGCTGHRLWEMLHSASGGWVTRSEYLRAFDRRNLLNSRTWSNREARASGKRLLEQLVGCRVVVVGVATLEALRLPRPERWGDWATLEDEAGAMTYCLIPHASGRCREYNDPATRERVGRLLLDLYQESVGRVG